MHVLNGASTFLYNAHVAIWDLGYCFDKNLIHNENITKYYKFRTDLHIM